MRFVPRLLALAGLFFTLTSGGVALAAGTEALPDRVKGKASAPITMIEYSSFTCSHCATFYNEVMPEIEKRYIETGKMRFIYRDLPADGIALKAAALTRCMPEAQFFPFVAILYKNQGAWLRAPKPEAVLLQYAQMAGLPTDKAQACLEDSKIFDALIAARTEALEKNAIQATPTFIINNGEDKIVGAQKLDAFVSALDKILAKKK